MNIGLIIYGTLDALTGGNIYDRILVDDLRQRGHQVAIITLSQRNYAGHLLENFSGRLVKKSAAGKFDLLLQDALCHPSLFRLNRRLRQNAFAPLVAVVHQVLCRQPRSRLQNRIYETVERAYFESVDAFIFNSNTTARTVAHLTGDRRPSLVACPAGDRLGFLTAAAKIDSRTRESGPLRLIFVGNLLPNKGLLPLIRGLSKLPRESWHLTVVGSLEMDRRYFRRTAKLIAAGNLQQQVALAGPQNGPALASLLARSHVFVMPYSHESYGMAHLEAMGFGLPVIGSASGAVKEFVIPGKNGFLIDPGDLAALLDCLKRLDRDRPLLLKMSRAALQTFHEHPSWSDTLERIYWFLCELVNKRAV